MDKLYQDAFILHDLLLDTSQYKRLKEIEKKMLDDKIASSLISKYQELVEKYGTDKSQNNLKLMHQAKLEMDQNELVIEYKKAYKEYQILLSNITDIVFKDIIKKSKYEQIINL